MPYSISDLAKEFDVTPRAIRFYEEQGLLNPERRGQTRIYSPSDRVRLKLILRGKRLGFTLEESRTLFELYDPSSGNRRQLETMLETIDRHRTHLAQQLHDIQVMMLELDEAETRCARALEAAGSAENNKNIASTEG
ncbi:MerR family transcriptional regulator [Parendozoicomonas haliclonae]|uniref:HTH-type transcriptional regulator CueR n=1 Tax=Parendozoicomonas haliclonae TaxID=1960125 RepID=A0A1X7AL16_9GAMM|nr:MerR family DNA-binding transcriptional regulator [Parendozoicomonas haliclonae]SMA47878.1 HTH-type transcriptional regulator CueR [Parendozoicomonas haliclonae]